MIIEGAISVKAVITNHKRTVKTVYIDKHKKTKDFNYLRKISKENHIEIKEMEREAFADLNVGKSFGGVACHGYWKRKNEDCCFFARCIYEK